MHEPRRTHVLDTSVLLADPRAVLRFEEHDVVVPMVSVLELDANGRATWQGVGQSGELGEGYLWVQW